jgi:hypothetical protein
VSSGGTASTRGYSLGAPAVLPRCSRGAPRGPHAVLGRAAWYRSRKALMSIEPSPDMRRSRCCLQHGGVPPRYCGVPLGTAEYPLGTAEYPWEYPAGRGHAQQALLPAPPDENDHGVTMTKQRRSNGVCNNNAPMQRTARIPLATRQCAPLKDRAHAVAERRLGQRVPDGVVEVQPAESTPSTPYCREHSEVRTSTDPAAQPGHGTVTATPTASEKARTRNTAALRLEGFVVF